MTEEIKKEESPTEGEIETPEVSNEPEVVEEKEIVEPKSDISDVQSSDVIEGEIETPEVVEEKGIVESSLRNDIPDVQPGDTVKVYQKIVETKDNKTKERIQIFEGVVLARKHGKGVSATITVRKVIDSVGVERIFPIHSPFIEKIEIVRSSKVRRAKLYYLREAKGRKARLRNKEEKVASLGE